MVHAESSTPYTLSFKVTGLDEASRYTYVLSVLDENNTPLHVYVGDFATLGYSGELQFDGNELIPTPPIIPGDPDAQNVATGVEETGSRGTEQKAIIEGRILFITPQGIYDITGKRIE